MHLNLFKKKEKHFFTAQPLTGLELKHYLALYVSHLKYLISWLGFRDRLTGGV